MVVAPVPSFHFSNREPRVFADVVVMYTVAQKRRIYFTAVCILAILADFYNYFLGFFLVITYCKIFWVF